MAQNGTQLPVADPFGWPVAADPFTGLPPSFREPLLITICIQCAAAGVVFWDIANSTSFDWRLIREGNWRNARNISVNVAYLTARWAALAFALTAITSITTKQSDCAALPHVYAVFSIITIATTSYIFAIRVIALWSWRRSVIALITLFFLIEMGFAGATLAKSGGAKVPHSPYCWVDFSSRPWLAGASGSILAFDTVVAILTFWRLARGSNPLAYAMNHEAPVLSRRLIKQGIFYYAITCAVNLVATILFSVRFPPDRAVYHVFWTIPGLCIMACCSAKVFRLVREELSPSIEHVLPFSREVTARHGSSGSPESKRDYIYTPEGSPHLSQALSYTRQTVVTMDARSQASGGRRPSMRDNDEKGDFLEMEDAERATSRSLRSIASSSPPFSRAIAIEDDEDDS